MNTMLRTIFFFLLLSVAVTTAAAQGQFTVWVEDQEGKPIKRAKVTLDCGDGTIHKAGTSSKGEAIFPLSGVDTCTVSITGQGLVSHSAVVAVKQSPEGIVIPVRRGSGGQNTSVCPLGQIPINGVCEIAVGTRVEIPQGGQGKKSAGQNSPRPFHILKVVDDKNVAVSPAEVFIACDGDNHTGYADRLGQFFFDAGGSSGCEISVSHPDFYGYSGRIDTTKGVTHVVSLERTLAMGITVIVVDETSQKPVPGVDVRIEGFNDRWVRTSDALGYATTNTLITPGTYRVTAEHQDYYGSNSSFEVPRSVGKTFVTTLVIKRKEHIKTIRVHVLENETDKPIAEAAVRLVGGLFSGYSGTTGSDGVASINVSRAGRFTVEVTRDYYFPAKTVFSIAPGAEGNDLEFFVSMDKKRSDGGIYPVKVKVMGEKRDGTTSPLSGASVSPGDGDGVVTGSDGWATVRFTGYSGDNSSIKVSKMGFEDKTVPFSVPRFSTALAAPEITITLKEKISGLVLRIEVSDRDSREKLRGATVNLDRFGTATTDESGIAEFSLSEEQLQGLSSVRSQASMNGYTELWSTIDNLLPSADPKYYSIALRRKISGGSVNPYGPGAVWKLREGYPRMGDDLVSLNRQNPNNSASPGMFSFEHRSGIVSKFSFDTPPSELPWGSTVRLSLTGTSLTPADALEASMARIYVEESTTTRSSNEGKLTSGKYHNSTFAVFPFLRLQKLDGTWTTSDTITFEFKPREGRTFAINICVAWSRTSCFMYSYEPSSQ